MTPMAALTETRDLLCRTGLSVSNRGWNADGFYHQTVTDAAGYVVGTVRTLAGHAGACSFGSVLKQLQAMEAVA